jgi:hypothetical protein
MQGSSEQMIDTNRHRGRALLVAVLGFLQLEPRARELPMLHVWLSNWNSIGLIDAGMARQGFDIQLTRYDEHEWRATFYTNGMEHSATASTASAFEPEPWAAVRRAAWTTLVKRSMAFV